MENIVEKLRKRGFIDQITSPELIALVKQPIKAYVGFDPTAESLHLGNLVGIVALRWFQMAGHTPVVVLGGATGRVGDPSGKSAERPLLSEEVLSNNLLSIETFFKTLFSRFEGKAPLILNNEAWLGKIPFLNFLRDVGKHFRLGAMLAKESVRARLKSEEGMSFTEFSYQVLQGYDFSYLSKHHGVTLQMGGSDQWGNITAGIEFHRKVEKGALYGLTFPLLTRSDGKKFGKTEEGAIWLSQEKLSPYHFYQNLFQTADADVISLLKMLTFLKLEEIQEIEKEMKSSSYQANSAQKILAEEVTQFIHGKEGLEMARKTTENLAPGKEALLTKEALREVAKDLPHAELKEEEIVGKKYTEIAARIGLCASRSEALRLIQNGGAYCNNEKVEDPHFSFAKSHLIAGEYLLLGSGKKRKILIQIQKLV